MIKGLKIHLISLYTVFKHLFKSAITLEYPEKKNVLPEKFKGKPIIDGCVKCGTCIKVCPSNAISYNHNKFNIDLKKCILCGNCSYYCPQKAIIMSNNFELATLNKNNLILKYKINDNNRKENDV